MNMEYLLFSIAVLYFVYAVFCISYFLRQKQLKMHERSFWIFLGLAVAPIAIFVIYRVVQREKRTLMRG